MQSDLIADIWNVVSEHVPEKEKQEVAKNLVTKVRVMHANLPSWLKQKCVEDNKLNLRYMNGSQIKAVSSGPEAARS